MLQTETLLPGGESPFEKCMLTKNVVVVWAHTRHSVLYYIVTSQAYTPALSSAHTYTQQLISKLELQLSSEPRENKTDISFTHI